MPKSNRATYVFANLIFKASVPTSIHFIVFCKDVDGSMADVSAQWPSSKPDFACLMKAFGSKCHPFIEIISIFIEYTKKNNHGNSRHQDKTNEPKYINNTPKLKELW